MPDEARVRINYSAGEIEISGTCDAVREWWLDPEIVGLRQRFEGQMTSTLNRSAGANANAISNATAIQRADRGGSLAVPETFGEFLHQFPTAITDIERALVAGFFIQSREANNVFATGPVNEILLQQGIRLANPSSSIRRNVDARRAILLGAGQFRVSQAGVEYLGRLLERERTEAT